MKNQLVYLAASLLWLCSAAASLADPQVLARNGEVLSKVVIGSDSTLAERTAAEQLCRYLRLVTGANFVVNNEAETTADEPQILVGRGKRIEALLKGVDPDHLEKDGIIIKTVGNSLVLAGDRPRGALYAVYQFLEENVGCRWWTTTEAFIPKKQTLEVGSLDVRYAPPFYYRLGPVRDDEEFITILRDNANRQPQSPAWGGRYTILGWVHTFSRLLPPSKYFKEHPEWYTDPKNGYLPCTAKSEMPGAQETQLCMSNPEVLKALTAQALQWIQKDPAAGYISISQNDNRDGYCRCPECSALAAKEGSAAAPLLQFVNQVAAKVGEQYPDFLVETLAYHYSEKPPKSIKPAQNVIIRMAPIVRDFGHELTAESNRATRENMEAWQAVGANLFIWDYATDFHHTLMPHPNLFLLADTLKFYADHGVKAVYFQGDNYTSGAGDFVALRTWLIGKLMWNPRQDGDRLITGFLEGYYADAAPYLRKYLELVSHSFLKENRKLATFNIDFSFLSLEVMNEATRLFNQAEEAVKEDPVLLGRVKRTRLSLDLAWLWQYKAYRRIAARTGKEFLGPADPGAAIDQFESAANALGVKRYRERIDFSRLPAILRGYLAPGEELPVSIPGVPSAKSDEGPIDLQENEICGDSTTLWKRSVEDPLASNKRAGVIAPGERVELYLSPHGLLLGDRQWRVYAAVRLAPGGKHASEGDRDSSLTFGIYDRRTRKEVLSKPALADLSTKTYKWLEFAPSDLNPECVLWVRGATPGGGSVHLDRVVLVSQK